MADDGEILKAHVTITADATPVKEAFDQVKDEAKKAVPEVESYTKRIKESLDKIKKEGGRRSGLGELAETLRGAGAVAGVAIIGELLNQATEKAAKLSEEFRQGKVDASGLAVGIGESLPIFGSFVSAGQNIRELFTGEKANLEAVNDEIKAGNELYEARQQRLETIKKGEEDIAEKIRQGNNALRSASAHTTTEKAAASAENKSDDQNAAREVDLKTYTEALRKEQAAAIAAMVEKAKARALETGANKQAIDNELAHSKSSLIKDTEQRIATHKAGLDATKALDDEAAKAEIGRAQSTGEEVAKLRLAAAARGAETPEAKGEAYKAGLINSGKSEDEAEYAKQAFLQDQIAAAAAKSRDALRGLNEEYRDKGAITFNQMLDANRAKLEEQARIGEISKDAIGGLQNAFTRNLKADDVRKFTDELRAMKEQFDDDSAVTAAEKIAAYNKHLEANAERLHLTTEEVKAMEAAYANLDLAKVLSQFENIDRELSQVGENAIQKQIDQWTAMAKAIGLTTAQIDEYAQKTKQLATEKKVNDLNYQDSLVGLNPLDKAKAEAKHNGEDPNAVGAASGKLQGDDLKEAMKTPFENFQKSLEYWKALLAANDIDQKTFLRLQTKAYTDLNKGKVADIHTAALEHLHNQFAGIGAGVQGFRLHAADKLGGKGKDKATEENSKATHDNTAVLKELNRSMSDVAKRWHRDRAATYQ